MRSPFFALALALFVAPVLPACALDAGQADDEGAVVEADDELALTRGRFETFVGADGQHYFHLLAGNGEKVLASEGYATEGSAAQGIASVQSNGVDASRYELRQAKSGEVYFVVKASNGQVVATSETYASKGNAERAIETVVKIVKASTQTGVAALGAKFEVFRGLDKRYYFHLRAANGEIILQSEGYTARASATKGIASVSKNGADAARYQLREAADGAWYFVLKAGNGAVIARGETYASKGNAERGIAGCVELLAAAAAE